QGGIILALLILLDHGDDGIGSDEACEVIDVAMSVVTGDAAIEPDDGLHTKIVGEHLLVGRAVHGRVALLDGGKQALLSGNQSAASVDVDRSTFEHDAVFVFERINDEWVHDANAGGLRHALSNLFVETVIRILGPRVKLKVQSERLGI